MKTVAGIVLAGGLITATAAAQPPSRVLTHPVVPARAALDRLNLQLGWRALLWRCILESYDGIAAASWAKRRGASAILITRLPAGWAA